jgi:rubrerythrin
MMADARAMSFTEPFQGTGPGRPLNQEDTLNVLRLDAAAELDAINLYQAHIDSISDPELKKVIAGIRDDEKEHLAEFLAALKHLDPIQAKELTAYDSPIVMASIDGRDIDARFAAIESRMLDIDARMKGYDDLTYNPPQSEVDEAYDIKPQNVPFQDYFERRRRGDESAYQEQLEAEAPAVESFNEQLRREIAARQALEGVEAEPLAYPNALPGENVSEWVSGIGGSPGIVVDEAKALRTSCIRISLGEGRKPLIYSPGIVGALDAGEQEKYCKAGYVDREATPKQKARIQALANAAHICSQETKGAVGTEDHLTRYFACLGRELKSQGVEV